MVSFIDFHADSDKDWRQIAELGMKLAESWPIMRGAVGLWLWRKPVEWRGGSLSIWDSGADLRRFIRWPVHVVGCRQEVWSWPVEPQMWEAPVKRQRTSIGLDVHARSVLGCGLDGETGELFGQRLTAEHGEIIGWIRSLSEPVAAVYEAGPTGYGLARALLAADIECVVAAPSKLIPAP